MKLNNKSKNILLLAAWLTVAAGVTFSLLENPQILSEADLTPLIFIIIVLTPITLACNAYGFKLSAAIIKQNQEFKPALKIVTSGTLANQLPIPAAFLLRIGALRVAGASMSDSINVTVSTSVLWIGCTFLITAAAAYLLQQDIIFILLTTMGLLAIIFGFIRLKGKSGPQIFLLLITGTSITLLDILRLYISFLAIGFSPDIFECFLLAAASAISNMATFIPGGIGVREYSAAGLSTFTSIPASIALLAVTINRIAGLIGAILLALLMSAKKTTQNP